MLKADKDEDLGRMFELVFRIPDGLNKYMWRDTLRRSA